MTDIDDKLTEEEIAEIATETVDLNGDEFDAPLVMIPKAHERLTQGEDESHEDFLMRRRMVNKVVRMIENRKKGYRQATRLVAGGLRNKMQDVYTNRETKLAPGEKAKRRAANKLARQSRKVNGQR